MSGCLLGTVPTGSRIELLVEMPFLIRLRFLGARVPLAARFNMMEEKRKRVRALRQPRRRIYRCDKILVWKQTILTA
jgi:hypothetical protein